MHRTSARVIIPLLFMTLVAAAPAWAQDERAFELEGQVTTLGVSEFDVTDVGVGVQAAWRTGPVLAIDGTLAYFPGGGEGTEFLQIDDQRKVLGLVGVRAQVGRRGLTLFGRARPGFLHFVGEDRVACIAIFPMPLACRLLAGETVFAAELGGGARVDLPGERTFVSVEVSDVLLRYDADAVLRPDGEIAREAFISHNPRVTVGLGWRF